MSVRCKFNRTDAETILRALGSGVSLRAAIGLTGMRSVDFQRWLASDRAPLRAFQVELRKSRATPLAVAEADVFQNDKKQWLRFGPGGWKGRRKAASKDEQPIQVTLLQTREWQLFAASLADATRDAPELRDRLLANLRTLQKQCRASGGQASKEAVGGKRLSI